MRAVQHVGIFSMPLKSRVGKRANGINLHPFFPRKLYRSRHLIPCVVLIVFIVWVMIIGWATATEAAAYGVLGSLGIAWWSGGQG